MTRLLPVLLVLGCGGVNAVDAGPEVPPVTYDGGPLTCTPNSNFCSSNALWKCTRSGRDAVRDTDCSQLADGGFCVEAAACPMGSTHVSTGGPRLYCCRP